MKRFLLALAVPIALLTSACGSDGAAESSKETTPSSTSAPASSTGTSMSVSPTASANPTAQPTTTAVDGFGQMMQEGAESQVQQRPDEVSSLTSDLAEITGEAVSQTDAQQLANVTCLSLDVEEGPGAVAKVAASMASDAGVSPALMARVVDRLVEYRCPEMASK